MFAVRTVAVLVLDLERDVDLQIHVLRQTVQTALSLVRAEGIDQVTVCPVLLQRERAQPDGVTVIDAGDGGRHLIGAVAVIGDGVGGARHGCLPIRYCQWSLDRQNVTSNDQAVRIVGVLLFKSNGRFQGIIPGEGLVRICCARLAAPNASFIHIQRRFRIVREHRLVVRAFDGDGDGLFRPRAPVVHDADHKGLGHALALAQLRDVLVFPVELIGIVPVLVQGQGAVLRGSDIPAGTILGDFHSAGLQIMAAAIPPHRGRGPPFGIAVLLQGELQAVVLIARGGFARAVFPVVIRSLHTAFKSGHGRFVTGRAVGMQIAVPAIHELILVIIEGLFIRDGQFRPVIGAGHRDSHFLAGPGAMLVLDEDGEGLRQRLAFIELIEATVGLTVLAETFILIQLIGVVPVGIDGQFAVQALHGDARLPAVGKVHIRRRFHIVLRRAVDKLGVVIGVRAYGVAAVVFVLRILPDFFLGQIGRAGDLVVRPIDHRAVLMTAHAAFRDVQRAIALTAAAAAQRQRRLVVGAVDGDGDILADELAERIRDRDRKGLGQHLALGQFVDGVAVTGLELIGIGTVLIKGQRTVGGFIDGRAVGGVGLELRRGDRRAIFSCLQRGALGFHREGQIVLVGDVHVRGRDRALQRGRRVMLLVDMTISIQNWPFGRLRIAVTVLIVDALFLEYEVFRSLDGGLLALACELDDDLLGVVSAMLIHHGDFKGLVMGIARIELLDGLALAVDHIGPAAVRLDGQGPVVGGERGGSFSPTFTTDVTIRRVAIGDVVLAVLCMAAALDADGLVETRVGIDVCDLEAARNFGPARRRIRGIRRIGIVLCGHKRDVSADGIPRRILERQRGLVVGARDGDGHGLQIPGAVLVLHIDGEGIRHLGVFRQLIDVLDRNGLIIVQRDRGTFRQLHLLTLQGVDPGAVTVQGQGAENAGHGVTALHIPW